MNDTIQREPHEVIWTLTNGVVVSRCLRLVADGDHPRLRRRRMRRDPQGDPGGGSPRATLLVIESVVDEDRADPRAQTLDIIML